MPIRSGEPLPVAHNRTEREGVPVDHHFGTRTVLDIEDNQRCVIDALGRVIMCSDYDMLSTRLRLVTFDGGTRWKLNDAAAKLMLE